MTMTTTPFLKKHRNCSEIPHTLKEAVEHFSRILPGVVKLRNSKDAWRDERTGEVVKRRKRL